MPPRLDLVGLVVADLRASLDFYRRVGLDLPTDAHLSPHGHVETTVGGLRIAWDTIESVRSFDPDWQAPNGSPRMALAFVLDSPAEVDALYAELVDAGYHGHKEPWDAFWGQRYAIVHDPDGNGVELFAATDASS